jgi:hypothetical protein
MDERRFSLVVASAQGEPDTGCIVVASSWRPEMSDGEPDSAFTIVLLTEPPAAAIPPPNSPTVAVCVPARRVRAVRETGMAYRAGPEAAVEGLRLPRAALAGYAGGHILAAGTIGALPRDVFAADPARPRLDLLAAALLKRRPEEKEREERESFWRALRSGLAAPRPWETAPDGAQALERVGALARRAQRAVPLPMAEPVVEALERLRDVAEGGAERFAARYTSPADLGEDVLLCRCLERGVEGAQELTQLRRYLIKAMPPLGPSELAADRIMTLEQLSFATLLEEPERLAGMRSTFQVFREAYRKAYLEQHRRYGEGAARLHALLEEAEPVARALARLNTLRALGPAVGRTALRRYHRLLANTKACAKGKELEGELLERPLCSGCGLTLADSPPEETAREAVRGLQRALARQHARLASEAVRQILARRGGERIERFLQIVQASDLSGLVNVLDDTLLGFLDELLAPAAASSDVLAELAQLFPSVGEGNLDTAVEEFRKLLETALDAQRQAAPRRAPRVRLRPTEAPPQ